MGGGTRLEARRPWGGSSQDFEEAVCHVVRDMSSGYENLLVAKRRFGCISVIFSKVKSYSKHNLKVEYEIYLFWLWYLFICFVFKTGFLV